MIRAHSLGVVFALTLALSACGKDRTQAKAPVAPSPPEAGPAKIEGGEHPAAQSPSPVVASQAPAVLDLQSHQFYGVYLTGQKAGWAEERVTVLPGGGVRLSTRVQLRIKRAGNELVMELSDQVDFGPLPDGQLVGFEMVEALPGTAKAVRRGVLKGDEFECTVSAGGQTTTQRIPRPRETAHDTLPSLLVKRLEAASGPITTYQFDRQQLRDLPIETTLKARKQTRINGVPTTVLEVFQVDKTRGLTMTNRISDAGRTLEMTLGPGLKLVLEDQKVAQNPALAVPDLYRLSVVPVDKKLGEPSGINRLKVRLAGLPENGASLVDMRQTRQGEVVEIRKRWAADVPAEALSQADRARWTQATAFIDAKEASIVALAKKSAVGDTELARVVSMTRAARRALSYTLATAPMTASQILAGGRGDCTEYARLLTAMARSLAIPAREVSGMAYAGDSDPGFAFHAWVELYIDGRWLAVDPTWNQAPIDATHIALSRDDPSAIVGLLGGLTAKVLELER